MGGMWFDSLSANPLGISILPLFVAGYPIYLRRELILRDAPFAQLALRAAASAAVPAITLLLLLNLGYNSRADLSICLCLCAAAGAGGGDPPPCL